MRGNRRGFHYAWVIAFCGGLLIFYTIGLIVNSFSLFLDPLIASLHISNASASSIAAVQNIGGMVMSFACRPLCMRFGSRKVILFGGLFAAAGYFYLSTVSSLGGCYAGFFLVGCGYGMGGMVPASLLVSEWFHARKGIALTIVSLASAFATIVYPPVITFLLARTDIFGVYRFLAGNVLAIILAAFLLVRDHPEDMGLRPYGFHEGQVPAAVEEKAIPPLKTLLRQKSVRLFLMVAFSMGAIISAVSSHIAAFYTAEGFSADYAAAMVSLLGIIMLAAKPIYGVVTDILPLEKTNVGLLICLAASMCAPFFFHSNVVPPSLFVILYGFTSPLSAMTFPLWAERIGQHTGGMASVYPIFRGSYSLGAIALLTLPGLIADKFGTYTPVFLVYFVLSVLSLILIQRALSLAKMEVAE